MAEQKGKTNSKQKRHKKYVPPKAVLTPEQIAEIAAAKAKAEAETKAEAERIHNYGNAVQKMSHRQLTSELNRVTRKEHVKVGKGVYEPQAGLNILLSTVLSAVLKNTRSTPVTDDGRRLRKDQLNPTSSKTMNPGW